MQKITIWHNPRCSKSRQALEILERHGGELIVRCYLDEPPEPQELRAVLQWLPGPPEHAMRENEDDFEQTGLSEEGLSIDEKAARMSAFPRVIERPIVFVEGNAIIARPPDKLHPWLAAIGKL